MVFFCDSSKLHLKRVRGDFMKQGLFLSIILFFMGMSTAQANLEFSQLPLANGGWLFVSFRAQDAEPYFWFWGEWTSKGVIVVPLKTDAEKNLQLPLISGELAKYPADFVQRNLDRITVVESFTNKYPFGGTWFGRTLVIVAPVTGRVLHHEFFSVIMNNYGDIDAKIWSSMNTAGFRYFAAVQDQNVLALNFAIDDESAWKLGFATGYARTAWTNDLSETAKLVMTDTDQAVRAFAVSPELRAKGLFIIQYLQAAGCSTCGAELLTRLK
jgi:hypothetical protein